MLGKATHDEFRLLARIEIARMAEHRVIAVRILLDRGLERQAGKLGQPRALRWRSEAKLAQFVEAFLGWHALVLLQRIIPRQSSATEMVQGEPCAVRGQSALTAEESLTVV